MVSRAASILAFFVLGVLPWQISFAVVSAHVDRTSISEIETVRLVISSDKKSQPPDFSVLNKDFDVLGTSSSSRVNIINGKMSSTHEWVTTLAPNRTGRLTIPAITVAGEKTRPVVVTVSKGSVDPDVARDIFIETTIKPAKPYVQSQIIYTIKFHHAVELLEGDLSSPEVRNAVTERVGKDVSYIKVIKGRRFRVTERKYAIFPQQSGKLVIPEIIFNGKIPESRSGRRSSTFDPFFGSAFQSSRAVRLRSRKHSVNVLPKPVSAKGDWWLPAKALTLEEQWSPQPPEFRVGDPVTRTLVLSATGLTEAQLPDLELRETGFFKLYPDQENRETITENEDLVGKKIQKIAFVPTKAGKTVIPEIRVNWWDTVKDKARVATIPSMTIHVLPAVAGSGLGNTMDPQSFSANALVDNSAGLQDPESVPAVAMQSGNNIWRWLAFILLALWLLTVAAWFYTGRRNAGKFNASTSDHQAATSLSVKKAFDLVHEACMDDNPAQTRDAIICWGRLVWPDEVINNLGDLSKLIHDDAVIDAVENLDNLLYSGKPRQWTGEGFWSVFSEVEKLPDEAVVSGTSVIKQLYPA